MSDKGMQVKQWPVSGLVPHPDNPRTVRTNTQEYKDLLESVKANGVIEPLLVRWAVGGVQLRQVLSGHHRLRAAQDAGLDTVPVIDRGKMADDAAYDVVAMGNIRVPLTPLEEGKRAATWLDKYGQDAQAVGGKLGQTPRWVVEHAQISRGLSADWHKAAAEMPLFDRWTSSHWAVIAKLPARIQAEQLTKFRNNAFCSYDRWAVKELESRINHQTFRLAKAPFPRESCASCVNRTGQQPLFLYADTADGATGDNELCLDRKCWQRKCEKAEREAFRETVAEKGLEDAVPLCLLEPPKDGWGSKYDEYRKKVSSCRRAHKGMVTADQVKMVKENTPGAVPAIVVAGVGKGTTQWVKVKPAEEKRPDRGGTRQPTARDIERDKEGERWERVCGAAVENIRKMPAPSAGVILLVASLMDMPEPDLSEVDTLVRAWQKDRETFEQKVRDWFWQALVNPKHGNGMYFIEGERETLEQLGPVIEIDIEADYQAMVEAAAKEQAIKEKTQIVAVAMPKSSKVTCELRLLEDGGKWYGGFLIEVPKARADLPVDTRGDAYETKTACVLAMVERVRHEIAGFKLKKSCPAALYKEIVAELDKITKACELELQRSGQGSTTTNCTGDCASCSQADSCNGAQLPGHGSPATGYAPNVKPSGLIEDPELIHVPLPAVWKAKVTLKIAQVDGKWYVGYDAHVPGEAKPKPCSTAHQDYPNRNGALSAAWREIAEWLADKPGKKGYKHHEGIAIIVRGACQGAAEPTQAQCSGDPDACDIGCIPCSGTRKHESGPPLSSAKSIASGKITTGLEPRSKASPGAGARKGMTAEPIKPGPDPVATGADDRSGPPAVDAPRVLEIGFPRNCDETCRISCQRIDGQWFGGYTIAALLHRDDVPKGKPSASKSLCLLGVCGQIRNWLMEKGKLGRNFKSKAVQIANWIDEAVEAELDKRTCRECGCTEDDCQACVEATGEACHWVEEDLCSRCQGQS